MWESALSVQNIGEKSRFQSILLKEKKKNKTKLSMLLRLLSNVLGVLDRLLHLIENKIYEKIFNIPFILQEAEALMKLLVSERDAFSNHIYLSLVNLWETASSI